MVAIEQVLADEDGMGPDLLDRPEHLLQQRHRQDMTDIDPKPVDAISLQVEFNGLHQHVPQFPVRFRSGIHIAFDRVEQHIRRLIRRDKIPDLRRVILEQPVKRNIRPDRLNIVDPVGVSRRRRNPHVFLDERQQRLAGLPGALLQTLPQQRIQFVRRRRKFG
ncbi:hypothetical protein D1872_279750 [compost metagenome]